MAYADEVLADSPLGYWKLDETSGTTVADSSGNGRDGVLTGSPGRSAGAPPGGGFDFDGSSRVNIADDAAWDVTTGLTIETSIFFPATPPSSYRRIFTRDNSSSPQTWTLGTNGGSWDAFIRDGGGSYTAIFTSGTVPTDNAWHLVIVESDATSSRLYVDDALVETLTGMSSWYASSLGLSIGSDIGGSYAWPEGVAHCSIYDGILGSTRRTAHWNAWSATATPKSDTDSFTLSESAVVNGSFAKSDTDAFTLTESGALSFLVSKVATDMFRASELEFLNYSPTPPLNVKFLGHRVYAQLADADNLPATPSPSRTFRMPTTTEDLDLYLLDENLTIIDPTGFTMTFDVGTPGVRVEGVDGDITAEPSGSGDPLVWITVPGGLLPGTYSCRLTVNTGTVESPIYRSYPTEPITLIVEE